MDAVLDANGVDLLSQQQARIVDFDDWALQRAAALFGLAYVLTGNRYDAEDLTQEALSRALGSWSKVSAADDMDAYVRRMLVNAHTSWWRKSRRHESPAAEVVAGGQVDGPSYDDQLWRACLRLPSNQRIAVVLRFYEDLSYTDIAALTGVREGSVRSRVSRGLAALREQMGAGEDDD